MVGDLAGLVRDSIGENGQAVMISIGSPRQIVVTKVIFCEISPIKRRSGGSAPMMREIDFHVSPFPLLEIKA